VKKILVGGALGFLVCLVIWIASTKTPGASAARANMPASESSPKAVAEPASNLANVESTTQPVADVASPQPDDDASIPEPLKSPAPPPESQPAVARGVSVVPGAIVCPDHNTVALAFDQYAQSWEEHFQDAVTKGQSELLRGKATNNPQLRAYDCVLLSPGTPLMRAPKTIVPVVWAKLADGWVKGVTLEAMVANVPPAEVAQLPVSNQAENSPNPVATASGETSAAGTPLPQIHNSPDLHCDFHRECTNAEFVGVVASLQEQWSLAPEWLRAKCVSNSTYPPIEQCLLRGTDSWLEKNPNAPIPWITNGLKVQASN
jgi:hypothetical protein